MYYELWLTNHLFFWNQQLQWSMNRLKFQISKVWKGVSGSSKIDKSSCDREVKWDNFDYCPTLGSSNVKSTEFKPEILVLLKFNFFMKKSGVIFWVVPSDSKFWKFEQNCGLLGEQTWNYESIHEVQRKEIWWWKYSVMANWKFCQNFWGFRLRIKTFPWKIVKLNSEYKIMWQIF
jgi:hypothetical protein